MPQIQGFDIYANNQWDGITVWLPVGSLILPIEDVYRLVDLLEESVNGRIGGRLHVERIGEFVFLNVDKFHLEMTTSQSEQLLQGLSDYLQIHQSEPVDEDGWWDFSTEISGRPAVVNWQQDGF